MSKYLELNKKLQNQINGIIAQFIDSYIRQNKVWVPEQMFESFYDKLKKEFEYWTSDEREETQMYWNNEHSVNWLLNAEGKKLSFERMQKKYNKDKKVANRKSPLVERVRLGFKWDKSKFYDLNYGLQYGYAFIPTIDFEKMEIKPWTILHVEKELGEKYNTDLIKCLNTFSTSFLEKQFIKYWLDKYYHDKNNPAIIPEVCGFREMFYYFKYDSSIYGNHKELPNDIESYGKKIERINYRYDFLIANFKKQKIAFVELDGFEYHKTREQQTIDSIKRNKAANYKISLMTFTSKRISDNIEAVFNDLEEFLK